MPDQNENTVEIALPEGSWKPIPHYHQIRALALELAALMMALPHFGAVVGDVESQSYDQEGGEYAEAVWILNRVESAIGELSYEPPNSKGLEPLAEELRKSMENWGPVPTTIFYLIQAHPDEAALAIADLIKQAVKQGGDVE